MVFQDRNPFVYDSSNTQEKYAIANRNFNAGDEIIAEEVLLIGPVAEPRCPICIGCGVVVNMSTKCYDCGWPICDFNCDKLMYHRTNECEIFRKCSKMSFQGLTKKRGLYHQYDCILPLRMLIFSERSPEDWKMIETLNSCVDIRRDTGIWRKENTYIVKYIKEKCKLKRFDEEFIHKICGIIDTNYFPVSTRNHLRCIYKNSLKFSHSCIPNTTYVILPSHDFKVFIKASNCITKGEKLTYSRVRSILPTLLRRQELVHTLCLSCCCKRCSDPTELSSHFSTLKCPKCNSGSLLSLDPLDFESDWECVKCSFKKKYSQLKKLYNTVEKELNKIEEVSLDESVEMCEKLLTKYESVFHRNHAFMIFLKYCSLKHFNEETFYSFDIATIDMKIIRLYEILHVFDIIAPGYTLLRGTTLNWLYKAYVAKAKCFNFNKTEEHERYVKHMSKALYFLRQTEEIMVICKPLIENEMEF